jgi:hypothetical protein
MYVQWRIGSPNFGGIFFSKGPLLTLKKKSLNKNYKEQIKLIKKKKKGHDAGGPRLP